MNPSKQSRNAAAKAAAAKTRLEVSIDFPQEGDVVRPGHYAVRVGAAGAGQAQVRVASGEWFDCREAAGYFWYDWTPAPQDGPIRLAARARIGKGRWAAAIERACVVVG